MIPKKFWSKLKSCFWYSKLVFQQHPVRTWRMVDGKYMCDGDCGRWTLHGVCTCGLCHFFNYEADKHQKINRDNVSWRRESDTGNYMRNIPYVDTCEHKISLNENCPQCNDDHENMIKQLERCLK